LQSTLPILINNIFCCPRCCCCCRCCTCKLRI